MENTEIKDKLENIEILLSTFIQTVNDPKKKAEESEVLTKAIESINSTQKEISGLISKEKALIENFKPVVEVKNYSVNVKEPLWWIAGALAAILISGCVCYGFYETKEKYKLESETKDWNYMKYKYFEMFGTPETQRSLKAFNKEYQANWRAIDQQINKREQELKEATEAAENARKNEEAARKLRQKADSLRNR